jgi:hypothetical protein
MGNGVACGIVRGVPIGLNTSNCRGLQNPFAVDGSSGSCEKHKADRGEQNGVRTS